MPIMLITFTPRIGGVRSSAGNRCTGCLWLIFIWPTLPIICGDFRPVLDIGTTYVGFFAPDSERTSNEQGNRGIACHVHNSQRLSKIQTIQ
jgi:hypothetical protein